MPWTPPLSVIVPTRGGVPEVAPVLDALRPQVESTGTEVILVGGPAEPAAPEWVNRIPEEDEDMYRLRLRGIHESTGDVIAVGEDHAVPRADWCEAVIRAHAEHADALAVAGSLVNGTERRGGPRALSVFRFALAAAAGTLLSGAPPPASAVSFKRDALFGLSEVGELEGGVLPRLCWAGQIAADGRIVVDHYQDHGLRWTVANGYHGGRSTYGWRRSRMSWKDQARTLRDLFPNVVLRPIREARTWGRSRDQSARR